MIYYNISFPQGSGWDYGISNVISNVIKNTKDEISPKAKVYLDITLPHMFNYIKGRYNILYAMYEAEDIPFHYRGKVNEPELLIVPCEHNKAVFSKYRNKPIEVVPLGYDQEVFKFHEKKIGDYFLYFYNGAMNPRKNYQMVVDAFKVLREKNKTIKLYFKTTGNGKEELYEQDGIIFDSRNVSASEMADLYKQANCFVFPSSGEGFGLPLLEAMATGTPAIHTGYSGMEFAKKEFTYHVDYVVGPTRIDVHSLDTSWAFPNFDDLVEKMDYVFNNYDEAKEKAYKGSIYAKNFTWAKTAKEIARLISERTEEINSVPMYNILNLGCGKAQIPWADNLDFRTHYSPDIVLDLNEKDWTTAITKKYSEVIAFDVVEHLPDMENTMKNIHTVLADGGVAFIKVPLVNGENAFRDPTHKLFLRSESFDYFDKSTYIGKMRDYFEFDFKILERKIDNDFNLIITMRKN